MISNIYISDMISIGYRAVSAQMLIGVTPLPDHCSQVDILAQFLYKVPEMIVKSDYFIRDYSKLELQPLFGMGNISGVRSFLLLCNVYNVNGHILLNIAETKARDLIF